MVKAKPPLALIAGPTASGKSALAIALARASGDGVIINADSAQTYRDLPVLSAAPSPADRAAAVHRLYGVRDGAEACSAAEWAAMARREISSAHARGQLPILVGGTGLYLRTLLDGIAPVPTIDPQIRTEVRAASAAANHAELEEMDPVAAARLNPGDSTRVARALEVVRSTGRTIGEWQVERSGGIAAEVALRPLIVVPPREWLVQRCDSRFSLMIAQGALAEVEALLARKLDPALPVMRAIGVRELSTVIRGECTLDEAVRAAQLATRRYAKRQYTWFANQPPPGWPRLAEPVDQQMGKALALLGSSD